MTDALGDHFDFTGRSVLITGGTKGLGRATAEAFLSRNAAVTVCARSAPEEPVSANGSEAHFIACDVRNAEAVTALVDAAVAVMGALDIVINNAGGAPPAAAADSKASFNEKVIGLNLTGPMNICVAAHPHLVTTAGDASIVNISSVSGMRANPLGVAYGAAKAGLINMAETLALEWGPDVRVNTVTAGPLDTPAARDFLGDAEMDRMAGALSMNRLGSAADVVAAILYLCSPMASWVTGTNLVVDGGPEWPQNGYPHP